MSLAGELADAVTHLSELRQTVDAEAPEPARSLIHAALDEAHRQLVNASDMATRGKSRSDLILAIERAERDGDDATADALLRQVEERAKRTIAGAGCCIVAAEED